MTATERLRQLLDKRGVEWEALPDQQEGDFTITATRWHDGEGGLLTMLISEPHGSTWDFFWLPTPEQAIAATLGTSQAADEWGDGFRAGCDAANGASRESVEHYKAENAKLRELVRDMMVAWWACDNERCPRHDKRCEEGKFCAFDECARDLGIEVDE